MALLNKKSIHLLGIGGAGMAGMAEWLQQAGYTVSGSDDDHSPTVERLMSKQIAVNCDKDPRLLSSAQVCVYSAAILPHHPLRQYADTRTPTYSRGQVLGDISRRYNTVAAVAGTHGKTTVTGMLTHILQQAGKDPSVLIGGNLSAIGGNGRYANPDLLVCEACEFQQSFLHLKRDVGIVLNIDNDHLECYGSVDALKTAFSEFLSPCEIAIVNGDDPLAREAVRHHKNAILFGDGEDYTLPECTQQGGFCTVIFNLEGTSTPPIPLKIAGSHNATNALAAATAAHRLGCGVLDIVAGLNEFAGVDRRFQTIYRDETLTVVDDYAHHPTEIAAVLGCARQMGYQHITAIFQPFTYSRTKALCQEFAAALSAADKVILTPLCPSREPVDPQITSHIIAQFLPDCRVGEDFTHCAHLALKEQGNQRLILTLGCGDVYRCAHQIAALRNESR